jgi:3-phosphoshikimate 1-carboxyvinyltransferase
LLVPDSRVTIENVGLNPSRTGLLEILARMGADVEVRLTDMLGPEPIGTIIARYSALQAAEVVSREVPNVIDELPLFLLCAARAEGVSRLRGAGELRAKESDRLRVMATFLRTLGVTVEEYPDGIAVQGSPAWATGSMAAHADHRMAMTAAVAGLASQQGVHVDDTRCIAVSFPGFTSLLEDVGGTWVGEENR